MIAQNKRDRLISAAATLFHRKGIVATSLADIAKDADIPIGNVYYYFKTKEELALAAILRHKEHYMALFTTLNETVDDPRTRLKKVLEYYEERSDELVKHGCPIGKMVMDTHIDGGALNIAGADVLKAFIAWSALQFSELGYSTDEASVHGTTFVCGVQGAMMTAKALQKTDILLSELTRLAHFIDQMPNKRIHLGKVAAKLADA